jgi:hypothetical protein
VLSIRVAATSGLSAATDPRDNVNARQQARMRDRKARKKLEAKGGYAKVEADARGQDLILRRLREGRKK